MRVGDIVLLKSGSPAMTVAEVNESKGTVKCVWFDKNGICYEHEFVISIIKSAK